MTGVKDSATVFRCMRHKPWFRPLLASLVLWSVLAACGSDEPGPAADVTDGGDASASAGKDGVIGPSAGKSSSSGGNAGASGDAAGGDAQAGAPGPAPSTGNRMWLGAAVGTGQGKSHVVSLRLGGPLSGRGTGLSVSVKLGKR
jgi:hypothetical protein